MTIDRDAALTACSCASADWMSGRCSTSFDGRLTGSSGGRCSEASSNFWAGAWLGNRPISAVNRSRCTASCFSNGGSFDRCDIQSGHLAELELLAKDVP